MTTTDIQAALQACIDVLLHDGVPTDPEHPKRIALNAAEATLASRPNAQESLASENVAKDSQPKVSQERVQADERGAIRMAIVSALGDAYDCTRVWYAWGVGTMGPDDFVLVADDDDRVEEIVEAVMQARAAASICQTCNGNGMIGGPSFYAPDEGGVPCPECASSPDREQVGEAERMPPYDGLLSEFVDEVARLCNDAPGSRNAVYGALQSCNAVVVPVDVSPSRECGAGKIVCGCTFDAWRQNPYTKTLEESIKNDYLPKADSAPTLGESKPAAWIRMDHLRQAQKAPFMCRVEPNYREGFDLSPIFLVTPQAAEPKGMTEEQIEEVWESLSIDGINFGYGNEAKELRVRFARAILSKGA